MGGIGHRPQGGAKNLGTTLELARAAIGPQMIRVAPHDRRRSGNGEKGLSRHFPLRLRPGHGFGRALRSLFPQARRPKAGSLLLAPCGFSRDDLARNPIRDIGTGCLPRGAGKRVGGTHEQDPFIDGIACIPASNEPALFVRQASRCISGCR